MSLDALLDDRKVTILTVSYTNLAGIKRRIPLITAQASFWRKNMGTV